MEVWQTLLKEDLEKSAEIIGLIDSGERWIFENGDKDSNFKGLVCNKVIRTDELLGVLSVCYYSDCLHIGIAFDNDIPDFAELETKDLLLDIVKSTELDVTIWCRNENLQLRNLIENAFEVSLNYASHEMKISKREFTLWKTPLLPNGYKLFSYDCNSHDKYIDLLEKAMAHVIAPNTTPYLDSSDSLKKHYLSLEEENRFHAIWHGDNLVGICYSENEEINTLALIESYRKAGLGFFLLHKAIQSAFVHYNGDICLYVIDSNTNAFEFYKHCGMKVTGHSARYIIN